MRLPPAAGVEQKAAGDGEPDTSAVDELCDATQRLVSVLRENSHSELALTYSLRSLATCFQHQSITQLKHRRDQVQRRQFIKSAYNECQNYVTLTRLRYNANVGIFRSYIEESERKEERLEGCWNHEIVC